MVKPKKTYVKNRIKKLNLRGRRRRLKSPEISSSTSPSIIVIDDSDGTSKFDASEKNTNGRLGIWRKINANYSLEDDYWKDSFDKLINRTLLREKNIVKKNIRTSFNMDSSLDVTINSPIPAVKKNSNNISTPIVDNTKSGSLEMEEDFTNLSPIKSTHKERQYFTSDSIFDSMGRPKVILEYSSETFSRNGKSQSGNNSNRDLNSIENVNSSSRQNTHHNSKLLDEIIELDSIPRFRKETSSDFVSSDVILERLKNFSNNSNCETEKCDSPEHNSKNNKDQLLLDLPKNLRVNMKHRRNLDKVQKHLKNFYDMSSFGSQQLSSGEDSNRCDKNLSCSLNSKKIPSQNTIKVVKEISIRNSHPDVSFEKPAKRKQDGKKGKRRKKNNKVDEKENLNEIVTGSNTFTRTLLHRKPTIRHCNSMQKDATSSLVTNKSNEELRAEMVENDRLFTCREDPISEITGDNCIATLNKIRNEKTQIKGYHYSLRNSNNRSKFVTLRKRKCASEQADFATNKNRTSTEGKMRWSLRNRGNSAVGFTIPSQENLSVQENTEKGKSTSELPRNSSNRIQNNNVTIRKSKRNISQRNSNSEAESSMTEILENVKEIPLLISVNPVNCENLTTESVISEQKPRIESSPDKSIQSKSITKRGSKRNLKSHDIDESCNPLPRRTSLDKAVMDERSSDSLLRINEEIEKPLNKDNLNEDKDHDNIGNKTLNALSIEDSHELPEVMNKSNERGLVVLGITENNRLTYFPEKLFQGNISIRNSILESSRQLYHQSILEDEANSKSVKNPKNNSSSLLNSPIFLQPGKWRKSLVSWRRKQSCLLLGDKNLTTQEQSNLVLHPNEIVNLTEDGRTSRNPDQLIQNGKREGSMISKGPLRDSKFQRDWSRNVMIRKSARNVVMDNSISIQIVDTILEEDEEIVEATEGRREITEMETTDPVLLLKSTDDEKPKLLSTVSLLNSTAAQQNSCSSIRSGKSPFLCRQKSINAISEEQEEGTNEFVLSSNERKHIYKHQYSLPPNLSPSILLDASSVEEIQSTPILRGSRNLSSSISRQQQQQQRRHSNIISIVDERIISRLIVDVVDSSSCCILSNLIPTNTTTSSTTVATSAEKSSYNFRDVVLRRCGQSEPIDFSIVYSEKELQQCRKIGEGVYGEVFMSKKASGETTVLKIIPIEGCFEVNGESQKRFDKILSEVVIAMELSQLRNDREYKTNGFVEVKKVRVVQGRYPDQLVDLWELYRENCGTENDHPEIFPDEQLYVVFELANGGQDLEAYTFQNALQSYSAFLQVALTLAIAERKFKFEHRDLHWGNVLLAPTDEKEFEYRINGRVITIPTYGIKATIIDYTLSRMVFDSCCFYNDLATDEELFSATGDYQFDIYRLMRKCLDNQWENFEPYTNILWLHYIIDKMINGARYRCSKSKKHRAAIDEMMQLRDELLDYKSASDYVECLNQ